MASGTIRRLPKYAYEALWVGPSHTLTRLWIGYEHLEELESLARELGANAWDALSPGRPDR